MAWLLRRAILHCSIRYLCLVIMILLTNITQNCTSHNAEKHTILTTFLVYVHTIFNPSGYFSACQTLHVLASQLSIPSITNTSFIDITKLNLCKWMYSGGCTAQIQLTEVTIRDVTIVDVIGWLHSTDTADSGHPQSCHHSGCTRVVAQHRYS